MMNSDLKTQYDNLGYVVIPGLISPADRAPLEAACTRATARTRAGSWPHRRTVGKQFPPYGTAHADSWGVQHLMHPDLCEPVFAAWYTSDALVAAVCALLACGEDALQMELLNLLINPQECAFALCWHRDDVRADATADEERRALAVWHYGVQWNTALYEDACLYIVPGSHKVPRTPEQKAHSATAEPPADPLAMPGAVQVTLQPGETVFYNSNILHCAAYSPAQQRATLHGCVGDVRGGSGRARNILQHGLAWMTDPRFAEGLGERGRAMLGRLQLRASTGEVVGYSLEG